MIGYGTSAKAPDDRELPPALPAAGLRAGIQNLDSGSGVE